eukprot:106161-Pyramimonas_sp.AAC.1
MGLFRERPCRPRVPRPDWATLVASHRALHQCMPRARTMEASIRRERASDRAGKLKQERSMRVRGAAVQAATN